MAVMRILNQICYSGTLLFEKEMHLWVGWGGGSWFAFKCNIILFNYKTYLISTSTEADLSIDILINFTAKARGASKFQALIGL